MLGGKPEAGKIGKNRGGVKVLNRSEQRKQSDGKLGSGLSGR